MAFATRYGYKTNVSNVVALAQGDEYVGNPEAAVGDQYNVVDLVLTGFSSGTSRRDGVRVAADQASATANQAWNAEAGADVVA